MNDESWDKALIKGGPKGQYRLVALPAELGRALDRREYDRVKVRVTTEGILLVPYRSQPKPKVDLTSLPDWGETGE